MKLSSLGDVVHTLPLIAALRAGLDAETRIDWVVGKAFAPLVEWNPHVSAAHILPSKGPGDLWKMGDLLRDQRYDTVMDAQGLLVSGVIALLSGAKRRIGFDANREGNRFFLTDPDVPNEERQHVVQRLLGFCDTVSVPRPARIERIEYLRDLADVSAMLAPALQGGLPLIGCVVGASVANKAWTAERWVECLRALASMGCRPVLLGAKSEMEAAAMIAQDAADAAPLNLVGQTDLTELAAVLARCAVVIGPDSGPTHLAVAVGTPVVGLYGVTDPAKTGPDWGPAPAIVLDFAQTDAPQELRRPRHPTLPDAIARIPVQAVVDATLQLLQGNTGIGTV